MSSELMNRAQSNALTGVLYFALKVISVLVINPLMVLYVGSSNFGLMKTVESYMGIASVADGKSSQALKWVLANVSHNNDSGIKKRAVGGALVIWLAFLPVLFLILCTLYYYSDGLIKVEGDGSLIIVSGLILVIGASLILSPLLSIPDSVLVGSNYGKYTNLISICFLGVTSVSSVLSAYFTGSVIYVSLVVVVGAVMQGGVSLYLCKRKINWLGVSKPIKSELVKFSKFSGWILGWSFVSRVLLSAEVLLIGAFLGATSVTNYIFTSYVSLTAISLSAVLVSSVSPGIGMLVGKGDFEKVNSTVAVLRDIILFFSASLVMFVVVFNELFITLWIGQEYYLGKWSNFLIAILMFQMINIRLESFLIDLSLDIKEKVLVGILSVGGSVILGWFFYSLLGGVEGVFLGLLIGRSLLYLWFPIIVSRSFNCGSGFSSRVFKAAFVIIISIICVCCFGVSAQSDFIDILVLSILYMVVVALYYRYLLGFESREFMRQRLNVLFKKIGVA